MSGFHAGLALARWTFGGGGSFKTDRPNASVYTLAGDPLMGGSSTSTDCVRLGASLLAFELVRLGTSPNTFELVRLGASLRDFSNFALSHPSCLALHCLAERCFPDSARGASDRATPWSWPLFGEGLLFPPALLSADMIYVWSPFMVRLEHFPPHLLPDSRGVSLLLKDHLALHFGVIDRVLSAVRPQMPTGKLHRTSRRAPQHHPRPNWSSGGDGGNLYTPVPHDVSPLSVSTRCADPGSPPPPRPRLGSSILRTVRLCSTPPPAT
eukprot:CAMPEP_0172043788 /NCGR_PEP_ID=MMETSP1041-20130122/26447_1 /TAXON_ID=464988 /ORGANISM="Hemiselmis andersenii, Strain CCMP439" /LENGTH=266 /DNA_ID=CAMNT_0012702233 /DNA_START=368 /DNA_END=1167 /DNA_ORIENTATION=-